MCLLMLMCVHGRQYVDMYLLMCEGVLVFVQCVIVCVRSILDVCVLYICASAIVRLGEDSAHMYYYVMVCG